MADVIRRHAGLNRAAQRFLMQPIESGFWHRRGIRVFENIALEIPQGDLAGSGIDDVIRVDWDFSAAAGTVDDELRNRVTGGVAAQAFNDRHAFRDRGAEVRGAGDEVALVKVIRPDAAHE